MRGHARTILSTVESARTDASSHAQRVAGRVRLGLIPTVAPYLLPRILARCRRRHPDLAFEISESPTQTLLAGLVRGELDAIVISPPVDTTQPLQLRPLFEDEFLLALPRQHRLAGRRRVKLADLRDEAMILLGDAHCLRGQALDLCRRAGYAPRIAIQSAQLDTVLGLVEAGLGLSLVPASARPTLRHRNVQFRPLGPERASRQIALAWLQPAVPLHVLEAVAQTRPRKRSKIGCRHRPDAGAGNASAMPLERDSAGLSTLILSEAPPGAKSKDLSNSSDIGHTSSWSRDPSTPLRCAQDEE